MKFSKQEELTIYRIIMELTSNINRHSSATEATIQLIYHQHQLSIMVEDNGKGFYTAATNGIGLKNISSRVNYLAGSLNIDSGEKGSTIMIDIPYKQST